MTFSILLNGNVSRTLKPSRRLRQGDPISPILFILCAEAFTRLMDNEERLGNLHGIKVEKNTLVVFHILYAYDLLVMSRAGKKEVEALKRCFDLYCQRSGYEANLNKSNVLFFLKDRLRWR